MLVTVKLSFDVALSSNAIISVMIGKENEQIKSLVNLSIISIRPGNSILLIEKSNCSFLY